MSGRLHSNLKLTFVSRFSWCSGYHICLTHRRSPVRSRAKTAVPRGLTARISGFHPEGPGSTPGVGNFCLPKKGVKFARAPRKLGQAQSKSLPSWAKVGFIHSRIPAPLQNGYNTWLSPGSPGLNSRRWKFLSPQKRGKNCQGRKKIRTGPIQTNPKLI